MLLVELHYAKLWVVCVALRGASWDRMPYEQREIAFEAKEAAMRCLDVYLRAQQFRFVRSSPSLSSRLIPEADLVSIFS